MAHTKEGMMPTINIEANDVVNMLRFFDDLPDPRSSIHRLHRLGDVMVIAICAVVAMADVYGEHGVEKSDTRYFISSLRHL